MKARLNALLWFAKSNDHFGNQSMAQTLRPQFRSWGARSSFKKETTDLLVRGLQSGKIGVERLTQFPIAVECRAGWAVFAPDHEGVKAGEF